MQGKWKVDGKKKSKISKQSHYDFSNVLPASLESESSERDSLFSRNGILNAHVL